MKRRDFVKLSSLGTTAIILDGCKTKDSAEKKAIVYPVTKDNIKVISTWNSGLKANKVAFGILENNGVGIDAIEKGLNITESDIENTSVGIGGLPDANGEVTLDACIMDDEFNCGSVSY